MLLPEILLNKESIKHKFHKSQEKILAAYSVNTNRKVFLSEDSWTGVIASRKIFPKALVTEDEVAKACYQFTTLTNIFTWAYTKKVYNLSPNLFSQLMGTGMTSDRIPMETFHGFPDWCAWFEPPVDLVYGLIKGFFARVVQMSDEYRLVLTIYISKNNKSFPEPITLVFKIQPDADFNTTIDSTIIENSTVISKQLRIHVKGFLNVVLYMCQDKPDLENHVKKSSNNAFRISEKSSGKPFISKGINSFDVDINDEIDNQPTTGCERIGSEKCPHVRSGFYRVYWTGPGRTIPKVKWVNSVFVNSDKIKD